MSYKYLNLNGQGHVATVAINRHASRNAMNMELMKELIAAASELRDEASISVVVLSGGEKYFTAGVDLKDPQFAQAITQPLSMRRRLFEIGPRMCAAWEDLPQVTIAAVEGFCIGGGVSLAVSCDFRVVAEDAFFRISEVDLGMNYSWATLPRLVNLVGPALSKQWVILAEEIRAGEAIRSGLAQWTAPSGQALQRAIDIAEKIASKPQAPVFMTKQTVNALTAASHNFSHMDVDQFALTLTSDDFDEGVKAFLEKRKPEFNKNIPLK